MKIADRIRTAIVYWYPTWVLFWIVALPVCVVVGFFRWAWAELELDDVFPYSAYRDCKQLQAERRACAAFA